MSQYREALVLDLRLPNSRQKSKPSLERTNIELHPSSANRGGKLWQFVSGEAPVEAVEPDRVSGVGEGRAGKHIHHGG